MRPGENQLRKFAVSDNNNNEVLVYTVVQAGRMLGLTRNASYNAAKRGDLPTIKIGKLIRVPKATFHRMLEGAGAVEPSGEKSAREKGGVALKRKSATSAAERGAQR
jgi:excisionase family DNA binding protein